LVSGSPKGVFQSKTYAETASYLSREALGETPKPSKNQPRTEHQMSTEQTALAAGQTPISDDLVKTAAVHMHAVEQTYFGPSTYAPHIAQMLARAALEAAYPAIRQQVAQEIAAKAHELAAQYQATAVTHRDISIDAGRNTPKGESHMATAHAYRNKADGAWAVAQAAREIGGVE